MGRFFTELRRRKVFQVAAVYAVVAWLAAQILSIAADAYAAPSWIMPISVTLLLVGFPIAIILVWAFEVTPDGVQKTSTISDAAPLAAGQERGLLIYVLAGLLVIALGWIILRPEFGEPVSEGPTNVEVGPSDFQNSIAVLPFENLSPNPDDAYFAAGIHEEILNHLTKIGALSVIARTSVHQYEDTIKTVPEIARELSVANILEGSVRYANDQVRITAQLIDGTSGSHIWSETYDRDFKDIFIIQSDVAQQIAEALQAQLDPDEIENLSRIPTDNLEAYSEYLIANHLRRATGLVDMRLALTHLNRALELDPDFPEALALRSNVYWNHAGGELTFKDALRLAQADVTHALELNPDLPYANLVQAGLLASQWEWERAEQSYRRGLQADPADGILTASYAEFRLVMGQSEEAVLLARRAVLLEPADQWTRSVLARVLWGAGQMDEAMDAQQMLIDMELNEMGGHFGLAQAFAVLGDAAKAREHFQQGVEAGVANGISVDRFRAFDAFIHAMAGDEERARDLLRAATSDFDAERYIAGGLIRANVALDEFDTAFQWLDVAVANNDWPTIRAVFVSPYLGKLRQFPRYQAFLMSINRLP